MRKRSRRDMLDPTGQNHVRASSARKAQKALLESRQIISEFIKTVPRERRYRSVSNNTLKASSSLVYIQWQLPPAAALASLQADIEREVITQMAATDTGSVVDSQVDLAASNGAAQEIAALSPLLFLLMSKQPTNMRLREVHFEEVVLSTDHQSRVADTKRRVSSIIKTQAAMLAERAVGAMARAMRGFKAERGVKSDVFQEYTKARTRMRRALDTEVNEVYNETRAGTSAYAADITGADIELVHVSALLPTTREHHAARHGRIYTHEEQQEWWSQGANRINCHCSTRPVVYGSDGELIDTSLIDQLRAEDE